eukprot:1568677-Pleurochrysis_carterae.AAC.1
MVRELERVEQEQRERDRAELAALREQVAALTASQERAHSSASHHQPAGDSIPPTARVPSRASLAIALNVAALCAAIAIGAMQLLDNGAQPHLIVQLCVLLCALPSMLLPSKPRLIRPQGKFRWCGRHSSTFCAHKHQTSHALTVLLLLLCGPRDLNLNGYRRAVQSTYVDPVPRPRSRIQPSSAFALAAADVELLSCTAFTVGRVGESIWLLLNAQVYWALHIALLSVGGDRSVLPFDTYRVAPGCTTSRSCVQWKVRLRLTALPDLCAHYLLPDSPRALLACFSIYAPWSKRVGHRRTNAAAAIPVSPLTDPLEQPTRLRDWPDASPIDLH